MNLSGQDNFSSAKREAHWEDLKLVVVGINYHSCPIFVREKFVIPESCMSHALRALSSMPHLKEAAILSTCNRTEVYAVVNDVAAGLAEIESFFLATQTVGDHQRLRPNFKLLQDDVALHLFRVAAGLDSLVIGEGQIMSQVKTAHRLAQESGSAGPILGQLFQSALAAGKRVRSETQLGRRAVSVSSAAVELARECLGSLNKRTALVIGAGHMAQICAKYLLADNGVKELLMVNRSQARLQNFAANMLPNREKLNCGFSFSDRHLLAQAADLVVVSTSAPEYVLLKSELSSLERQLCIIDISVPRNVDPEIAQLKGIELYHADDLSSIVNKNLAGREALCAEAEKIIFDELTNFHAWQRSLLVAPTITDLRKKIEAIRAEHLVKHERSKHDLSSNKDKSEFEELSRALINQILHHPTTQLKATSDYLALKQQAEALRRLFRLDIFSEESCPKRAELRKQQPHLKNS